MKTAARRAESAAEVAKESRGKALESEKRHERLRAEAEAQAAKGGSDAAGARRCSGSGSRRTAEAEGRGWARRWETLGRRRAPCGDSEAEMRALGTE